MKKPYPETKSKLDKYCLDSALSCEKLQKWFIEFGCGRMSTKTIPSPGRPHKMVTPGQIIKTHDIVLNDPKVKVREIAQIVFI